MASKLTIISLAYAFLTFGLPATTVGQAIHRDFQNQILFSPVRVIDFVNPGFELTYNRQISPRFTTAVSGAYMVNPLFSQKGKSYKGYRFSFAPRYLTERRPASSEYLTPEFVYYKTRFPSETVNFHNGTTLETDTFSIRKKMIMVNFLYGKQFCYNRLVLDLAVGLGIKYRDIQHFDRTLPAPSSKEPNILLNSKWESKSWAMNFPVNFRLGYRF